MKESIYSLFRKESIMNTYITLDQLEQQTEKKIKNIGKVCTSTACESKCFPHCIEGCLNAEMRIEFEE